MVIDTGFSLPSLGRCDDIKICECRPYDLSLKLEAYEPPILCMDYATDWLESCILNCTVDPIDFYVCVELDCKKFVCVSLPVREIYSISYWEIDFQVSFIPP